MRSRRNSLIYMVKESSETHEILPGDDGEVWFMIIL